MRAYRIEAALDGFETAFDHVAGFKSVGLNLNGLPTDAIGRPILDAATVKPEAVRNVEIGVKTEPAAGVTANLTAFAATITTSRRRSSTPASACSAAISPTPNACGCGASSSTLPGISKAAVSIGGEYARAGGIGSRSGQFFGA